MFKIKELNSQDEFLDLKERWNYTLERSGDRNIFLTWEWLSTWWKYFGRGRKLVILLAEEKDRIIGIAPLMYTKYKLLGIELGKIEFIGAGNSDYSNFILTEDKSEFFKLILNHLNEYSIDWDYLELEEIPETTESIQILRKFYRNPYIFKERVLNVCPYIPLPKTFDVFLKGKRRRVTDRRHLRRLKEKYKVEFRCTTDVDSVRESMETFFQLHQKRWESVGASGLFLDPISREFHLDIAKAFAQKGWLNLYFLLVNDKAISVEYGFEYNKKYYGYLSGFDPAYSNYSPSNLLRLYIIQECIQKNLNEYDFLRGEEPYKSHWTPFYRKNLEIRIFRKELFPNLYDWIMKSENFFARRLKSIMYRHATLS